MFRLLILFVFFGVSDVCCAQRYCSARIRSAVPTATYTTATNEATPPFRGKAIELIEMISSTESFGTYRPMPSGNHQEQCPSSIEEIKTLLNLARILEEKEKPKPAPFNPEELIMKLVNALVVTSTQNRCPSDYGHGGRGTTGGSHGASRGQRDGLVNLDLLNPNNPNNVAQLDLGRQTVAGIGIGDNTNGVVGGALKDLVN